METSIIQKLALVQKQKKEKAIEVLRNELITPFQAALSRMIECNLNAFSITKSDSCLATSEVKDTLLSLLQTYVPHSQIKDQPMNYNSLWETGRGIVLGEIRIFDSRIDFRLSDVNFSILVKD